MLIACQTIGIIVPRTGTDPFDLVLGNLDWCRGISAQSLFKVCTYKGDGLFFVVIKRSILLCLVTTQSTTTPQLPTRHHLQMFFKCRNKVFKRTVSLQGLPRPQYSS